MKKLVSFFIVLAALSGSFAQTIHDHDHENEKVSGEKYLLNCAMDDLVKIHVQKNPDIINEYVTYEENLRMLEKQILSGNYPKSDKTDTLINGKRIIPVVFHVIHKGGQENISKAQIEDAIEKLNIDYNKQNPDTANTASIFKSRAADCQIEFRLARKDPYGNCTDGIHRVYDPRTDYAQYNVMRDNAWPYSMYMNVYVVSFIYPEGMTLPDGALIGGLSPFTPDNILSGTNGDTLLDGVLIRHDCIGTIGTAEEFAGIANYNNQNRVFTHETGHFFNLYHTFQDITAMLLGGDGCGLWGLTNGDEVDDTPPVKEATQGCPPLDQNTCSTDNPDEPDMVQNYMDYASGWCQTLFTLGQLDRINTTLMGTRRKLWSYENLVATGVLDSATLCPPIADFYQNAYMICAGDSITFTDWSYNGQADSWKWILPGGYPAISNDQNPTVVYPVDGVYDVTFIAMNSEGSDTITKTASVYVFPGNDGQDLPYSESFETGQLDTNWFVYNEDGNSWEVTDSAAHTGTYCMRLGNYYNNARFSVDELVTQPFDLTQIVGVAPRLTFDIAYAGRRDIVSNPLFGTSDTTDIYDALEIYVSTNCGKTWMKRYGKIDSTLATTSIKENNFIPASTSEWRNDYVSLSGLTGYSDVRIKFKFTSKGGNNLYIDNLNIASNINVDEIEANNFDYSIYPNPSKDNTEISFSLNDNHYVEITINDIVGKKIKSLESKKLSSGSYSYLINTSELNGSGVYFITVSLDGMPVTKRFVVQ
ncbi:MAG: hypothetical protein Kow0068_09000 [Marinilabiliales bacterium]